MPAETHVGQGPLDRAAILALVKDRLADILEIDPSSINEGDSFRDDLDADSLALIELVEAIEEELEAVFEAEKKHFKQTTDVGSGWLKDREQETEAAIESRYRQERDGLMELLLAWMGDVMRHQVGVERLDLPQYGAATRALAERWDMPTVSRRLKELRKLYSNLHTNVQESLALDVAFISAFA